MIVLVLFFIISLFFFFAFHQIFLEIKEFPREWKIQFLSPLCLRHKGNEPQQGCDGMGRTSPLLHCEKGSPRAADKGCPDQRGRLSRWVTEHILSGCLTPA